MTASVATALTFLGATRTVTGSRFLVETPSVRVLLDCGHVPGHRRAASPQLGPLGFPPDQPRRGRAQPRPPRPQWLAAPAGPRRVRGTGAVLAVDGPGRADRAPRRGPPAGGGRRARGPARIQQAPPAAAAVHHGRRREGDRTVDARPVRATVRARRRRDADPAPGRAHSRIIHSGAAGRRRVGRLHRRPGPVRPSAARPARPRAGGGHHAGRVDLRRPGPPAARLRRRWANRSALPWPAAGSS